MEKERIKEWEGVNVRVNNVWFKKEGGWSGGV